MPVNVLILGNRGGTNVGESLVRAATHLDLKHTFIDILDARSRFRALNSASWRLRDRRLPGMGRLCRAVLSECEQQNFDVMIATGLVPLDKNTVAELRRAGVRCVNYLTDDPWNPHLGSSWVRAAIPEYSTIFSVRRSNIADLQNIGCPDVRYLPFGFDPYLFYPVPPGDCPGLDSDVFFAGGADADRVKSINALVEAGLNTRIYGAYWNRFAGTRSVGRGYADIETIRHCVSQAAVCLVLVRRANRDGHAMRSFEIPAMRGVVLAESTDEHRELFGTEGECVAYFTDNASMIDQARRLIVNAEERARLSAAAYTRIRSAGNTYTDRLVTMIQYGPLDTDQRK